MWTKCRYITGTKPSLTLCAVKTPGSGSLAARAVPHTEVFHRLVQTGRVWLTVPPSPTKPFDLQCPFIGRTAYKRISHNSAEDDTASVVTTPVRSLHKD